MVLARDLQAVGRALDELMNFSIENKRDLDLWYGEANEVRRKIISNPELSDAIPHIVWHYLSDADTRLKDAEYAKVQNDSMIKIIYAFRHGRVPL